VVEPEHVCPLCRGDGFVHVLERVFCPPVQVLEHPEYELHEDHFPLTGHSTLMHLLVLVVSPTHALPPCNGMGAAHERVRVCVPYPQSLLQTP